MLSTGPVSAGSEDGVRPLRLVTYNLLHDGPGSGFFKGSTYLEDRLEMAIRELKTLDLDILAVQEASDSRRHGNVPERLTRALGLHVVFAPATEHIFGLRPLDSIIIGLLGALAGGFLMGLFGFRQGGGFIYTTFVAVIGAVLLTWIYRKATAKKT